MIVLILSTHFFVIKISNSKVPCENNEKFQKTPLDSRARTTTQQELFFPSSPRALQSFLPGALRCREQSAPRNNGPPSPPTPRLNKEDAAAWARDEGAAHHWSPLGTKRLRRPLFWPLDTRNWAVTFIQRLQLYNVNFMRRYFPARDVIGYFRWVPHFKSYRFITF